jgi:hypothetical protein
MVSNGQKSVVFWQWDDSNIEEYSPPPASKDFKHQLSNFSQSLFIPDSNVAVSATKGLKSAVSSLIQRW